LAGCFTIVVNAVSVVLFPAAVVGSQDSIWLLLRFAAGHGVAVFVASAFSFWCVFAIAGLLLAVLPPAMFRRISVVARFAMAIVFLALLGGVFTVSRFVLNASHYRAALLPPLLFLGLARTVWGRGAEPLVADMSRAAFASVVAVISCFLSGIRFELSESIYSYSGVSGRRSATCEGFIFIAGVLIYSFLNGSTTSLL
jgi:hypothetical protein